MKRKNKKSVEEKAEKGLVSFGGMPIIFGRLCPTCRSNNISGNKKFVCTVCGADYLY